MRNCKTVLLGLLLTGGFCFSACDKYNSKISGKVFYTNVNDNKDYPAAGAIITKMVEKGDSLRTIVAVVANENGEFLFDHTTKGDWILSGKLYLEEDSVTSYFYYGQSEKFTTNGENHAEQTFTLKHIKDDTE